MFDVYCLSLMCPVLLSQNTHPSTRTNLYSKKHTKKIEIYQAFKGSHWESLALDGIDSEFVDMTSRGISFNGNLGEVGDVSIVVIKS